MKFKDFQGHCLQKREHHLFRETALVQITLEAVEVKSPKKFYLGRQSIFSLNKDFLQTMIRDYERFLPHLSYFSRQIYIYFTCTCMF